MNIGISLRGLLSIPIASQLIAIKSRYITWLKSALAMHYKMPTVTTTGPFALEIVAIFDNTTTNKYLTDNPTGQRLYSFLKGSTGKIIPRGDVVVHVDGSQIYDDLRDGKPHTILLTGNATGLVIDLVGIRQSLTEGMSGGILSMNFISGFSQEGNPAGNPHYRFDTNYLVDGNHSNVVRNVNAELGTELIDLSAAVVGDGPSTIFTNIVEKKISYTVVDTWGERQFLIPVDLVAGKTYRIKLKNSTNTTIALLYTNVSSEAPEGWLQNNYYGCHTSLQDGSNEILVSIPSNADLSLCHISVAAPVKNGQEAWVSDFSIKEAPGYAEAINIKAINAEYYEEQDDGNLLGEGLWTFGSGVADGTEPQYSTILGTGSSSHVTIGDTYRYSINSIVDVPRFQFILGNSGVAMATTQVYSGDVTVTSNDDMRVVNLELGAVGSFSQISVRRLIKVAT